MIKVSNVSEEKIYNFKQDLIFVLSMMSVVVHICLNLFKTHFLGLKIYSELIDISSFISSILYPFILFSVSIIFFTVLVYFEFRNKLLNKLKFNISIVLLLFLLLNMFIDIYLIF